ncbi:MAG TPA: hypothetical protein VGR81_12730 [Candidatus Acidoferrales bacterium]|nr:hypothetical protein [Candidatus Acidoferrales bacterium]
MGETDMNCVEFQEIVHELAHQEMRGTVGALDKPRAVIARFHVETCQECAARLAEAQSLALALAAAAEDSEQFETPAYVEPTLVSVFREHHQSLERARHRRRQTRLRWLEWSSLAAAAAVLLAIGIWNLSRPHPGITNRKTGIAPVSVAAIPSNAQPVVRDSAPEETAEDLTSDFVPVPYAEGLAPGDPGMIVRVQMQRGALGSLGYPVDEAHAADVVQADLLVGEDGWPRAVRLVQPQ